MVDFSSELKSDQKALAYTCIAQYVLTLVYVRCCSRCLGPISVFELVPGMYQPLHWSACRHAKAWLQLQPCSSALYIAGKYNSALEVYVDLYDDLVLQRKSDEPVSEGPPVGTSEDWVVLDSGKSFAWSAKQHGSLQQQIDAMEKLIQQQGQQVQHILDLMPLLTITTSELL